MKVFRTIRNKFAFLDICPSNQSTWQNPFNKRVLGFILLGGNIVSHVVYIFRVANDFLEFVECLNSTFASIIISVCFVAIVFRKTTLFNSIDNIEKVIDASELVFEWFFVLQKNFEFILNWTCNPQDLNIQNQRHSFGKSINRSNDCVKSFSWW